MTENGQQRMEIVDAQVHLNMVGIDAGLVAMDAVGVDAVLIDEFWSFDDAGRVQPGYPLLGGSFRHTAPFSELAVTSHADRFAYIARYEPDDPDLPALIADLKSRPGRLALRLIPYVPLPPDRGEAPENARAAAAFSATLRDGRYDSYLTNAERHGVPLFLQVNGIGIPGDTAVVAYLAQRYPDLPLILDHTGVSLPGQPGVVRPDRFDQFEDVVALARHPNVYLKWGHAPRLSAEPFPYPDLSRALHRVVEGFGAHRVMWASDWTIDLAFNSWADSLYYIRADSQLSEADKSWLLGGTVRAVLGWRRPGS